MKIFLSILFILLTVSVSFAQPKKRGKVKRKYREVEEVAKELPPVFLRGKIRDLDKNPLPGARIVIIGTKKIVHANDKGEYFFYQYTAGKVRIQASMAGYQTKWVDVILQNGQNLFNLSLPENEAKYETEISSAQNRPQQILDVPASQRILTSKKIEENNISTFRHLAEFVPGVQVQEFGYQKNILSIRGIKNSLDNTFSIPSISNHFNGVPQNQNSGNINEMFDLRQIEVLKGPQGTSIGRGAMAGSILVESNKPNETLEGNISASVGNYAKQKYEGMINIPIFKDKLLVRAAGIFNSNDGYIENTFGGNLNGKKNLAGRISTRFTPNIANQIDLIVDFKKYKFPGLGYMNAEYPNATGETFPFNFNTSLNISDNLQNSNNKFNTALIFKHFRHEHNYWTSRSSFNSSKNSIYIDADATLARVMESFEDRKDYQFFQEVKFNFSRRNQMNGSIGSNYKFNKGETANQYFLNEQNFFHLLFDTGALLNGELQPQPVVMVPNQYEQISDLELPDSHTELRTNNYTNHSLEGFLDFNYTFWKKFGLTAGVRGVAERLKMSNTAKLEDGESSTFGLLNGNSPNFIFYPNTNIEQKNTSFSLVYRGGLQYFYRETATVYFNYSKGRRPKIVDFGNNGNEEKWKSESIENFELGWKANFKNRVWFDAAIFYCNYLNFLTPTMAINSDSTQHDYFTFDNGKATNYGAEANLKIALAKGLQLFGNYNYIFAEHATLSTSGTSQIYANQSFLLTPEHSFQVGVNAKLELENYLVLFARPNYAYQTTVILRQSSINPIIQKAHGLLNATAGFTLPDYNITFLVFGTNLLNENYIEVFENKAMTPIQIPGTPRMFGTKLSWKF